MLHLAAGRLEILKAQVVLECCNVEVLCRGARDDERDDSWRLWGGLQSLVKPMKGLDKKVHALVKVLVPAAGEEVQSPVKIKRVAGEEVPHHELVDAFLVLEMQVLKLVQRSEVVRVEAVGKNEVRLAAKQVLSLARGHLAHGGEGVSGVGSSALDRELAPDRVMAGGFVRINPREVRIEVWVVCGDIPPEHRGVRRKDGRNREAQVAEAGQGDSGHPLMEVGNDLLGRV